MPALASRTLFFAVTLIGGPLLAYGAVMLLTDGLGLVRGDSAAIIPIGLAVPAVVAVGLGRIERRTSREIALAVIASAVLTVAFAVALIDYTISRLSPEFFN